jgi:lipoprotein-anchoring transpeptidase ErfK/SrfK
MYFMKNNSKIFNILTILVILIMALCLIVSACSSGLTQLNNDQSKKENNVNVNGSNQGDNGGDNAVSSSGSSITQEGPDEVIEGSNDSSNNSNDNSSNDSSNSQEPVDENSNSGSNENIVNTDDTVVESTTTESTITESTSAESSQQISKEVLEKPSVKLSIIEGPEYAQDGAICYYRVKAEVTGNPIPKVVFSKDDSNGTWGSNITQINLTQSEAYNLVCNVSNSEGSSTASIALNWVEGEKTGTSSETTSVESNQQGTSIDYSNPGNFKIDVNLTAQLVSIYYNDNLVKSLKCSGGTAESPTITGTFTTNQKIYYAWVPKFNMGAYYWVRFYGAYLFHSVPFDKNGNMIAEEAAKIGTPASHGCIRMSLEDEKWFYETLPLGIKVTIHY